MGAFKTERSDHGGFAVIAAFLLVKSCGAKMADGGSGESV
jgi:hypothetical protein